MQENLRDLADELRKFSHDYATARKLFALNKMNFELILATHQAEFRKIKRNAGYDVMVLMLLEKNDPEINEYYRLWKENEARYKASEKVMDAIREKLNVEKIIVRSDGSVT